MKKEYRKGGFTLVELLVVISIISLLSSVVLASVNSAREKARIAAGKSLYAQLNSALGAYAVGSWSFEEGTGTVARDSSGEENNGTIVGAQWRMENECELGLRKCLFFGGTGNYIEVPHSESLAVIRSLTMAAWIQRTGDCPITADTCMIVNKEYDYEFGVRGGNTLHWAIKPSGGTWFWHNTGIVIRQDRWTHVVVAYDGAAVYSYRDGRLEERFDYNMGDLQRSGAVLRISGRLTQPSGSTFNGLIDEVRVYSEVLTAYQVQQMYAEGSPRHRVVEQSLLPNALNLHFRENSVIFPHE